MRPRAAEIITWDIETGLLSRRRVFNYHAHGTTFVTDEALTRLRIREKVAFAGNNSCPFAISRIDGNGEIGRAPTRLIKLSDPRGKGRGEVKRRAHARC